MAETQRWTLAKTDADSVVFKQAAKIAQDCHHVSNIRGLGDLVLFWGMVAASYALLLLSDFHWAACCIAYLAVAKAHGGLLLCGHEATHKLIFRQARYNDFAGQYFCFAPLGIGFQRARLSHIDHHHYLMSTRDEKLDQQIEHVTFGRFLKHILSPLTGTYLWKFLTRIFGFKLKRRAKPEFDYPAALARQDLRAIMVTQLVFFTGLTLIDWRLYIFFWAFPLITLTAFLHNAKGFLDHVRWPDEPDGMLYSYRPSAVDRLLFGTQQKNHAEHHLFPHIPYYRLPQLSELVCSLSMVRPRNGYFGSLLRFGRTLKNTPVFEG